jgi:amino acid transporter
VNIRQKHRGAAAAVAGTSGDAEAAAGQGQLRRELRLFGVMGFSVGSMSPAAALALNGVAAAALVGRAVSLAFLFAAIGVIFVAYGFIRLSQHVAHAGSVYAFTGLTLGSRAGFFSGWALLGTYMVTVPAGFAVVGLFGQDFLVQSGIWRGANWFTLALITAAVVWALAAGAVRNTGRSLVILEFLTITLIIVLMIIILVKVSGGHGPVGEKSLTFSVFKLPAGVPLSAVGLAAVFGFLSFSGFEASATLGEETANPRRNIPRALLFAVGGTGILLVLGMAVESLGFGATTAGAKAFASSSAPLGDLAKMYVGTPMADLLNLGATISAFGATLGIAAAGSRLFLAMARDGTSSKFLTHISPRSGAPTGPLTVVMGLALTLVVVLWGIGTTATNLFFYLGTMATLSLLVAYILVNVGAIKYLFIDARRVGRWEIFMPVIGIAFLLYTLYRQVIPVPSSPYNYFPYIVAAYLIIGASLVIGIPGMAARVGAALAKSEGLEIVGTSAPAADGP